MSIRVLVVEDEPLIRLGLVLAVEDAGYEALEAADADAAIAILDRNADVRVVVTDVDMPGSVDGARLAHLVARRWPPIRIIVVSGKLAAGALKLPAGARFFPKPCSDATLIGAIREMTADRDDLR